MESLRETDFPVKLTQAGFTQNLQLLPTSSGIQAARRKILPPEDINLRQRKLGGLCWLDTVSRPDIGARLARIPPRVNFSEGSDVYRRNDLVNKAKVWRNATILKYSFPSSPEAPARGAVDGRLRSRAETMQCGPMSLVGWSDASSVEQPAEGNRRLGYVLGLFASTLKSPCHIVQWTSKFTRKLIKRSPGGEVYAFSGILGHMSMLRDSYTHLVDLSPGMIGLGRRESLFTH